MPAGVVVFLGVLSACVWIRTYLPMLFTVVCQQENTESIWSFEGFFTKFYLAVPFMIWQCPLSCLFSAPSHLKQWSALATAGKLETESLLTEIATVMQKRMLEIGFREACQSEMGNPGLGWLKLTIGPGADGLQRAQHALWLTVIRECADLVDLSVAKDTCSI